VALDRPEQPANRNY